VAIGIVAGLKSEARLLDSLQKSGQVCVALSGADSGRAARAAEGLASHGVSALLSFGLCGALAPSVAVGDLVLPAAVRDEQGQSWPCDPAWYAAFLKALCSLQLHTPHRGAVLEGAILGADRVVAAASDKAELGRRFDAKAVDMESHAVAAAAQAAGLPFLVVRACSDRVDRTLPPVALRATAPGGGLRLLPVLVSLARHPRQLPHLMELRRGTKAALAALAPVVGAFPRERG